MSKVVNTRFRLRKDTAEHFNAVAESLTLLDGEVCIVDTGSTGIRLKVGDGVHNYAALPFIDADAAYKQVVVIGYYSDGNFYTDTVKTKMFTPYTHQLYIDYITKYIYYYNNSEYVRCDVALPVASASEPGILKLYSSQGQNEDGTITQKFFTNSLETIDFAVEASDSECLVLSKPW